MLREVLIPALLVVTAHGTAPTTPRTDERELLAQELRRTGPLDVRQALADGGIVALNAGEAIVRSGTTEALHYHPNHLTWKEAVIAKAVAQLSRFSSRPAVIQIRFESSAQYDRYCSVLITKSESEVYEQVTFSASCARTSGLEASEMDIVRRHLSLGEDEELPETFVSIQL